MRNHAIIAILLLLGCLSICDAFASRQRVTGSEIARIVNAPRNHSYYAAGTTMISWHEKWYKSKISQYHRKPNKNRIEYASYPLAGVVVCCDGKSMWRIDPMADGPVYTESTGCMPIDQKMKLFSDNYRAYKKGNIKQAGRNAFIIEIMDETERLRKRLKIDAATYVTLASEEYDRSSKMISSTTLVSIDYNARIPDSIFKRPSGKGNEGCENLFVNIRSLSELSQKVGFKVNLPKHVPKGFRPDGYRLYTCSCECGYKSAYIRYSNGLSGISIFQSTTILDCSKMCGENTHTPAEKPDIAVDDVNIYIIADLKPMEIKKIANSFK